MLMSILMGTRGRTYLGFVALAAAVAASMGTSTTALGSTPYNAGSHCAEGTNTNASVTIWSSGGINRSCRAPVTGTPCTGACYHGAATGTAHVYRQVLGAVVFCNFICSAYWFNGSNGWFSASLTSHDHV